MDYKVSAIVMLCELEENGKVRKLLIKRNIFNNITGIMLSILESL